MNSFNLENQPKINSGFKTPEHYFENFSEQMLAKIGQEEKPVISIFQRHRNWFLVAAAVLILGIMIPFLNKPADSQNIDDATIENYLAQSNISQYELVNMLDDADIDALERDLAMDESTLESAIEYNGNLENYITE
jgi:hypothetical protein